MHWRHARGVRICGVPRSLFIVLVGMSAASVFAQEAPSTSPAPPATGPAPMPTADDLRKLVDAGQYRDALKGLLRVLDFRKVRRPHPMTAPRCSCSAPECQLQLHEATAATDALNLSLKDATATGKVDDAQRAMALQALVARSPGQQFTPKARPGAMAPKAINILDHDDRLLAYKSAL